MGATVMGTFTGPGQPSQVMNLGGSFKLSTVGCNANNTVKTQKSLTNGASWTDVTTYNSEQTNTVITPASHEQYRLVGVAQQANHDIAYKLSRES